MHFAKAQEGLTVTRLHYFSKMHETYKKESRFIIIQIFVSHAHLSNLPVTLPPLLNLVSRVLNSTTIIWTKRKPKEFSEATHS